MNCRREIETENGVSLASRENNSLFHRHNLLITNLLGLHLNELLLARFSAAYVKVNRVPKDFKFMIICEIVKEKFFIFLVFFAGVKIIQKLNCLEKDLCENEREWEDEGKKVRKFVAFDGRKNKTKIIWICQMCWKLNCEKKFHEFPFCFQLAFWPHEINLSRH